MKMLGIKLILMLVFLGFVAPMFIRGPDGQPIMTLDDWIPSDAIDWSERQLNHLRNWFDELGAAEGFAGHDDQAEGNVGGVVGAGSEIYRWRDANGVLHLSDTPVDGAGKLVVPENGLEIPSGRFVQSGLAPPKPKSRSSRSSGAILLEEREFPPKSANSGDGAASLQDVGDIANGDFSNAGNVAANLPELIEQLKMARHAVRDTN